MMQTDERTERIRRLSRAIKDNALTGADLLSLAVQASAKKQLQRHDYPLSAQKSAVKSASKFVSEICQSGAKENLPPQSPLVQECLRSVRKRLLEEESGLDSLVSPGKRSRASSASASDADDESPGVSRALFRNIVSHIDAHAESQMEADAQRTRLDLSHAYDDLTDSDDEASAAAAAVEDDAAPVADYDADELDAQSQVSGMSRRSRYSTAASQRQVSEDAHRLLLRRLCEDPAEALCELRGIGRVRAQRLVELQTTDDDSDAGLDDGAEAAAGREIERRLLAVGMTRAAAQRFLRDNLSALLLRD